MMQVNDAEMSIYYGLAALPWRPSYLAAMWILCGELQSLYEPWICETDVPLMASTLDLVREVVIAGESPQAAARGWELGESWELVREAREEDVEVSGGLLDVVITFKSLALEIADPTGRYHSAGWVTNAVEDRWRDPDDNWPLEQADDSSPMAQTLTLFLRVVSGVAAHQGPETDPVRIREQILGPR